MKITKVILFFAIGLQLAGCTGSALFLANSIARFGDYTLISNIEYGAEESNKLDLYQPSSPSKATIIFFYGGCWGACQTLPKEKYRFVAQTLTELGYAVVIPDYRLYPKVRFSSIINDAKNVFQWVSNNAQVYGLETESIILMGHSAGAHIAAMLSTNEKYLGHLYPNLKGFVGLAGPYDFPFDQDYQYDLFSELTYKQSQPSYFVDGAEAPMLLLHGGQDNKVLLRNLFIMRRTIAAKNGVVEAKIYEDVNHAQIVAALSRPLRNRFSVVNDINGFLDQL